MFTEASCKQWSATPLLHLSIVYYKWWERWRLVTQQYVVYCSQTAQYHTLMERKRLSEMHLTYSFIIEVSYLAVFTIHQIKPFSCTISLSLKILLCNYSFRIDFHPALMFL